MHQDKGSSSFTSLLGNRNFSFLLSGQAISWFGDSLYTLSLLWLVQEMTGSTAMMGLVAACRAVPALFGVVAGGLVDRLDKRASMLCVSLLQACVVVAVPLLHTAGLLRAWHIPVVAFLLSLLSTFFVPARQSLLPYIVDSGSLVNANALLQMLQQTMFVGGYAVGGLLIKAYGVMPLFSIDAATFIAVAAALFLMRPSVVASTEKPGQSSRSPQRSFGEELVMGLRFLAQTRAIAAILPLSVLMNFVFSPMSVLMPGWVKGILKGGPDSLGFIQTSMMVGMILGSLSVGIAAKRLRMSATIGLSLVALGVSVFVLSFSRSVLSAVAIMFMFGVANGFGNVAFTAYLQSVVPPNMTGRAFGTLTTVTHVAMPVGQALGGVLAEQVPVPAIFAAQGIVISLATTAFWFNPNGREALESADAALVRA